MGEVLTAKRQTVVDRLRRRFDHYRKHHNACLPRYKQSTDSVFEKQRQDTLVLKQRYLESKAKKAKTGKNNNSEHHKHTVIRESTSDAQKLPIPKPVKRVLEQSPAVNSTPADTPANDSAERPTKNIKTSSYKTDLSSEQCHYNKTLSSPKLAAHKRQLLSNCHNSGTAQQFPTKTNPVKLLDGCSGPAIKAKDLANLPLPEVAASIKSQSESITVADECSKETISNFNLMSNVVECKQEKGKESSSNLCQFQDSVIDYSEDLQLQDRQDRLSDTFPSIGGFADGSGNDVITPDLLKDLIDDVFTNSADIMKDFVDFDDSVGSVKIGNEDNINKNDILMKSSALYQPGIDGRTFSVNQQPDPQEHGLFDNPLVAVSTNTSQSTKSVLSTVSSTLDSMTKGFAHSQQHCLPTFSDPSPSHQCPDRLSLDFKLTKPSPAALTLKQMAEQHQNMQEKQRHARNLEFVNRNAFNANAFPEPMLFSFRNRFLLNENLTTPKFSNSSANLLHSVTLGSELPYPGVEPISAFKRKSFSEQQFQNNQGQLIMRATGHREKSHFVNNELGWSLDPSGHSNTAIHPMGSQSLASGTRPEVTESRVLGIGYDSRNVHEVQKIDLSDKQPAGMAQQPYPNTYNTYTPQQCSNVTSSMFSPPLSQNISYGTHFNSTVEPLPLEYKLDQLNAKTPVEQAPVQTPGRYQQAFARQQPTHNQNTNNQWRHLHLPQNSLNIDSYQHHDSYRQLSTNSQMTSTTTHHNVQHHPYTAVIGHGFVSRPNMTPHTNQQVIQQRQQINSQFLQRQSIPTQHRLNAGVNVPTVGTETSHSSSTNSETYNVTQDSQINLDFLDCFDQVLQSEGATHFQLLDHMEILNK